MIGAGTVHTGLTRTTGPNPPCGSVKHRRSTEHSSSSAAVQSAAGTPGNFTTAARLHQAVKRGMATPASSAAGQQSTLEHDPLLQMVQNVRAARSVAAFARLEIADCIQNEPKTAEAIAQELDLHAQSVFRLLRAAATCGVVTFDNDLKVSLTTMGQGLLTNPPPGVQRMRNYLIAITNDWPWVGWGKMEHSVRTGQPTTPMVLGKPAFEYFKEHPDEGKMFADSMTDFTAAAAVKFLEAYPFSESARVVDYGGSEGAFLKAILAKNPKATGVLYDLPYVVAKADVSDFGDRIMKVGGDWFKGPYPEIEADYYILKHNLHLYPDDVCVTLLNNLRAVIRNPEAKVLIVETEIPDSVHDDGLNNHGIFMDINMLVNTTGRERSASEYGSIYEKAGFKMTKVVPTNSDMFILEGMLA